MESASGQRVRKPKLGLVHGFALGHHVLLAFLLPEEAWVAVRKKVTWGDTTEASIGKTGLVVETTPLQKVNKSFCGSNSENPLPV